MKSNELRIGNFLNFKNTAVKVDSAGYYINGYYIDRYEPIILDDDWFIKFGFKQGLNEGIGIYYLPFFPEWEICQVSNGSFIIYHEHLDSRIWCKNISYVHQLQNVFFSLMDIELNCA